VKLSSGVPLSPFPKRNPKQTSRLHKVLREATTTQTATIKLRKSEKQNLKLAQNNTFSFFLPT